MKYCKLTGRCLLFLLPCVSVSAQSSGQDIRNNAEYRNARQWLQKNAWIVDSLTAWHVPPREAVAVVFPELMRYSALEDKMEVTGLMVLYARLGKDYADFSVGRFQMKPSFIRELETDAKKYLRPNTIRHIAPFIQHGEDTEYARERRVQSLTNVKDETAYLALFYKICVERFKHVHFKNSAERIRFLATAYNCGYHHTVNSLCRQMTRKQFPVYDGSMIYHANYADLALAWWRGCNDHQMACL